MVLKFSCSRKIKVFYLVKPPKARGSKVPLSQRLWVTLGRSQNTFWQQFEPKLEICTRRFCQICQWCCIFHVLEKSSFFPMKSLKNPDVTPKVSSEIVTVGQLVSIVAAPLSGPRKVEKCNQTLNFCQISDLFPHTSAKKLWNYIFHFEIFLVFFAL